MRPPWRLGLLLGLLLVAGATIVLIPGVREQRDHALLALAPSPAGWTSLEGAPEWALPVDPNGRSALRRTYQRGPDTLWVSVAVFSRQQEPERRAAINLIYPERNTVRIDRLPFTLSLNGSPDPPLELPAMVIQRDQERRLLVVYWHQMGRRAYGSEYAHRLALTRDILFARRADSVLVRIATPLPPEGTLDQRLGPLREIAPALYAAVRLAGSASDQQR
ncbi:MAG: exosortase-associated EpsI family protein [Candidatus Rokubacteria bacterium]|nr:exosortase-associated EpsI family protein [Candidatus Rokubacteria bacterium]